VGRARTIRPDRADRPTRDCQPVPVFRQQLPIVPDRVQPDPVDAGD